jgi:hypothetical protein
LIYEKIRQLRNNKLFIIVLLVSLLLVIFLYLKAFFTTGVNFNGVFLKKEIVSNETHYTGRSKQGAIHITVIGRGSDTEKSMAEVIYNLPNNINQHYTVYFNHKEKYAMENVEIRDENENTVFEGMYQKGDLFLYDVNNGPLIEDIIFHSNTDTEVPYAKNYKVSFINIVRFSTYEKEQIKGHLGMLLVAVVLIAVTAIDIKYPLFFFMLRYSLDVEDPKPSEHYITMQRAAWGINSVIALTFLILALKI